MRASGSAQSSNLCCCEYEQPADDQTAAKGLAFADRAGFSRDGALQQIKLDHVQVHSGLSQAKIWHVLLKLGFVQDDTHCVGAAPGGSWKMAARIAIASSCLLLPDI